MKIAHRLLLGLFAIYALAGATAGTIYYLLETGHERRRLELVGGMVADQVFGRLEARMRLHREPLASNFLGDRPLLDPVRRVFLVNGAGSVRVTSDASLQGRTLARTDEGCRECHGVAARHSVPLDGVLRRARPLAAEASCRACHASAGAYLGCLVVDLDLADYRHDIVAQIGAGLLLLLVLFAAIGGATLALARRWISRRLDVLDAVMRRFEGGDLSARATVSGHDEIALVEEGFNRMASALGAREQERDGLLANVRTANDDLQRGEERIRRAYDVQRVLNDLLRFSLGDQPLEAVLKRALDLVLGISWLTVEAKGCVFIAEGEALVMRAQRGLNPALLDSCRSVGFGQCVCGRAAAERRMIHTDNSESYHDNRCEASAPHGHYCVPILSGQELVGVLNLYVSSGHVSNIEEVTFLAALANTLAGVISRRGAEERLRVSEQRFRTLAEAASDTIFIVDRERRIVFVNGTGARLVNLAPEALIGKGIAELFPAGAAELMSGSLEEVLATGEARYREDPFAFPDGELWLGTTLVALPGAESSGPAGVFGIARDITAQRRAQAVRERLDAELRALFQVVSQSHKEWQNTFDGITDMVSILDGNSRILKVNKAFAAYFGAHPREVVDHTCREFCIGGHKGAADCPLLCASRSGGSGCDEVLDPRTGRVFRVSYFPYASAGEEVDRYVRFAEDVTGERERAQRLMLSERLAALGQMASGIAHEINNPLASIAGCAEALLSRIENNRIVPDLFRDYLGIIHEEVFRCKRITTAMLSFVRQGSYEPAEVRLDDALERALELVGFQGRLRSVTVARAFQPDLPPVLASEGELRQVLLIVLSNALDAMKDQGELRCGLAAADGVVTLSITDEGPGIAQEVMGNLFTPFLTTKAAVGGTGLGLSIAKRIIEDFGGEIAVDSRPGAGTTVVIRLPAAPGKPAP